VSGGLIFVLAVALLVGGIALEGRRQRRRYGGRRGTTLMRTGLLELQRHLEPERKVEHLIEDRAQPEPGRSGDPPRAGGGCVDGNGGGGGATV
jgi:hypothetical protein